MSTQRRTLLSVIIFAVLAAALVAAALWWRQRVPASVVPQAEAPAAIEPPAPPVIAEAAPKPAIEHLIEQPAELPLAASGIGAALGDLLGQKAVDSFFQLDGFPRRFVATVDSLGRSHAPPLLWPINPAPGRFSVDEVNGSAVVSADNSLRYAPLVTLAETVDAARAVDTYIRMYPLMQQAYEELGYPKRYFNDRLIEVLDQLLATPEPSYPLKVELTEVKGPISPLRPWVRYEFADPALETLSAGQKMLVRVGPVNERRLKAKLAAIRQELVKRSKPS
jgi:Protein of unknown function (DUF3014)